MTGRIRVLPPETVAKIAAGEVVERPASVVKELVENALDAGAAHIVAEVERGGKRLIRVSDDGCGMSREDSIKAFERHATSKISSAEDLSSVTTLGFRGEALAAIAAVARVRLTTRPQGEPEATEVRAEGGRVTDARAASRSQGTTVEVRELFYNVPARRKFMRSDGVEADHVLDVLTSYALARPDVGFRVVSNSREILSLPPAESLGERVAGVFGVQVFRELLPVMGACRELPHSYDEYPLSGCVVRGYISRPSLSRGRPSHMRFFLNGRWFSDRMLDATVLEGYGELLPAGRYPVGVLHLEMNPAQVDVNVHPAKSVVRFADEGRVRGAVLDAVRSALATAASQPHGVPGRPLEPLPFKPQAPPRVETGPVQRTIYGAEAPPPPPPPEPEKGLPELELLGQAHNLYIIGQTKDGIVIVDQHAAHERICYERLREQFSTGRVRSQTLLTPRTMELGARERRALEEGRETVGRLGYQVEEFGGRSVVVKAVPVVGGVAMPPESLREVLGEMLESFGRPARRSEVQADRLLKLMACHESVRSGERLEAAEMRELVDALYRTQNPFSCPHGRPTMIHMSRRDLERKFGRSG
ncbi:MAG: DNA mismatch repair endonuclease MutL [Thermoplasmatota archaeon]